MIGRQLSLTIPERFGERKAIALLGARQTGKTTLLKDLLKSPAVQGRYLWLNGDEPDVQTLLDNITSARLRGILGEKRFLFIDEAQR
ncbi:MAG: AAA family ATPase, partial [Spirochaetaceae bacterium]|nr:AAA family ATPase [Spirochaetaceae bacterium]